MESRPTDFSRSMGSLVEQRSAKPRADQKLANPSNSKKPRACKERLLPNPPNSYEVGGHRPPLQEAWGAWNFFLARRDDSWQTGFSL